MIAVRKNTTTSIYDHLFSGDNACGDILDFSMCNPPFYTNLQELWESRSPARPSPKNGFTGSPQELITEGGELNFCRKMITESKNIQQKILMFTTMVGHKYNLKELIIDLKADGIKYTTTEFCQGRVTRWGLAWTYQDYDFTKLEITCGKSRKKVTPITFTLPETNGMVCNLDDAVQKIKTILQDLQIVYKVIGKRSKEFTLDIVAHRNTWSNQRRKRRFKLQIANKAKVAKVNDEYTPNSLETNVGIDSVETNSQAETSEPNSAQQCKIDEPIIHATLRISISDSKANIDMIFLKGVAGKEGLHQIIQYIKNNWK